MSNGMFYFIETACAIEFLACVVILIWMPRDIRRKRRENRVR